MNFARHSKKQLVSVRSCITWNADEAVVTTKSKIELNSIENCLSLTFIPISGSGLVCSSVVSGTQAFSYSLLRNVLSPQEGVGVGVLCSFHGPLSMKFLLISY